MNSSALKKYDYVQDNIETSQPSSEEHRLYIIKTVEASCNLPGNVSSVDLEEFMIKYSINASSDFA